MTTARTITDPSELDALPEARPEDRPMRAVGLGRERHGGLRALDAMPVWSAVDVSSTEWVRFPTKPDIVGEWVSEYGDRATTAELAASMRALTVLHDPTGAATEASTRTHPSDEELVARVVISADVCRGEDRAPFEMPYEYLVVRDVDVISATAHGRTGILSILDEVFEDADPDGALVRAVTEGLSRLAPPADLEAPAVDPGGAS